MSTRLHRRRPAFLVALFALASLLILGAGVPEAGIRVTPEQQLARLLADPGAICHGDAGDGQQAPRHHTIDCALCPYCIAIAAAAMLRSDHPTLPPPRAGPIAVAVAVSRAITLPPPPRLAAAPRGPPTLG